MLCQLSYTRNRQKQRQVISCATPYAEYADEASDSTSSTEASPCPEFLSESGSYADRFPYTQARHTLSLQISLSPQNNSHSNNNTIQPDYSRIFVTTPDPTVLPPSRIANRLLSAIAIGFPSSTSSLTLSPGMHISAPPSKFPAPVTSVVRK